VSNLLQRQQTKWVAYSIAVICIVSVIGYGLLIFPALAEPSSLYPLVLNVVSGFLLLLIPLSFGFAMLRYQLWDIDIIINRTLVYGALTVILTAVYVGLVIGLQALLRGIISQDSGVAIVISTLAIYWLFQPLRRRIQRIVDRRFYRSKYDAAKTVAAFSATLRQEVDLDQLREQLLAVVQETMQPSHVSLWLCPPEPSRKRQTWLLARIDEEE
jgi:Zn-dependent protease with chaperone function